MKKAVLATLIGAALFSGATLAADQGSNFDRVEARYIDLNDFDGDTYGVSGRMMLNESIYLTADYIHQSYRSVSLDQIMAGVGYKHDFSEKLAGFVDINGAYADGSGGYDESGYAVQAGGVYRLNPAVEFSGLVRHVDIDEDNQEFELAARWYINSQFSLSATYIDGFDSDTADGYFIGAAWHF